MNNRHRISYVLAKSVQVLIALGAVASVAFLFLVEAYNAPALDDLGFINTLRDTSIWRYVANMYLTWEGRYMSFIEHGVQYRMYELFHSTVPYSVLLYAVEIALLQSALRMFMRLSVSQAIIYSIWIWGLFVVCLPDLSSYFWMCTKAYPLLAIMAVWLLAKIYFSYSHRWYDYLEIVVVSCFVGCSTEVFAPMILVLMGVRILRKWKQCVWSISLLFQRERLLCVAFIVAAINFFAMVFAPGNLVRMNVHADVAIMSWRQFAVVFLSSWGQILKMIFFKLHYYLAFFVVLLFVLRGTEITQDLSVRSMWLNLLRNSLIGICLLGLSMILCEWACGQCFIARAFAQLPVSLLVILALFARDIVRAGILSELHSATITVFALCAAIFVFSNVIYTICNTYPELQAYEGSVSQRMEKLMSLQDSGNTDTIFLEPLDDAEYHSIADDVWRMIMPKYTKISILKSNEVANSTEHYYNVQYRKYYNLNFSVISDLVYEGV